MLAILLKSGEDRAAWRRLVRDAFETGKRGDWAVAKEIERPLREHRLLQPLFS
jgi:hypothetical protein